MAGEFLQIKLPSHLWSEDPETLFSLAQAMKASPGNIELDASEFEFIDPLGIAVLGATWSFLEGKIIRMVWLSTGLETYLRRMNFFQHCVIEGFEEDALLPDAQRANSIELTCISEEHMVDSTAQRLAEAITRNLTTADPNAPLDENSKNKFIRFSHPLQYALTELMLNSLTHAKLHGHFKAAVWVAAQVTRTDGGRSGLIKFSVVDNGCGMLGSLRKHSRLETARHEAAIKLALEARVSCNRDGEMSNEHGNEGVGLTTTSRIAEAGQGHLTITSGDAYVCTEGLHTKAPMADGAQWDGVAISFECKRKPLPKIVIYKLFPEVDEEDALDLQFS